MTLDLATGLSVAEHLSFVYTIKNSEHKEVSLGCCTPSDVQVITEEERKKSKDTGIRKKEHLFAVRSVVGKGPRTYFLEAINDDEMTSWACKLKEYLSRGIVHTHKLYSWFI